MDVKKPPDKSVKHPAKNPPKKDACGLFVIGNNGGKGRPKGRPDRRTAPFRAAIDKAMPAILDNVIEAAKNGDLAAAKILIDRSLPSLKPIEAARAIPLSGSTLTERAVSVIDTVVSGTISVDEATRLIQSLSSMARILEAGDLTARIEALEIKTASSG